MSSELACNVEADLTGVQKYSYSKLSSIYQCPYSFWLNYSTKNRGLQNGFAECGSLVHEILEKYLVGKMYQFEMKDYFLEHFNEAVPNGVYLTSASGFKVDLTDKYKTQISSFLENFEGFQINGEPLEIITTEKRFEYMVKIDDKRFILNGILDVIAKDKDGNLYIIDHKSKAKFASEAEKRGYAKQLYIYAIYICHTYGKFPKALVFDMFRVNHLEVIDFKKKDYQEVLKWARDSVEKIETEDLFLPVDFTGKLKDLGEARESLDDLVYDYANKRSQYAVKQQYKEKKKDVEDQLFFCMNLCGYRNICSEWQDAQKEYLKITTKE